MPQELPSAEDMRVEQLSRQFATVSLLLLTGMMSRLLPATVAGNWAMAAGKKNELRALSPTTTGVEYDTLTRGRCSACPARPDPVLNTAELTFRFTQNVGTDVNSG